MEQIGLQPLFNKSTEKQRKEAYSLTAKSAVALYEKLALLQTVNPGGKLELKRRLLCVCQKDHSCFVVRIRAQGTDSLKIQIRQHKQHIAALLTDVLDANRPGLGPEQGNVDQVQHALRRFAVTVHNFIQQVIGILLGADSGHAVCRENQ